MIADVHFSEEEYQRLLQMKRERGKDYMTDQEFLEMLLKEKMPQIREQIQDLELEGKTALGI